MAHPDFNPTAFKSGNPKTVQADGHSFETKDILPNRSAEVVADNYLVRYLFGALGNAVALPAINAIGVGAFNLIATSFVLISCLGLLLVIYRKV